MKEAKKIIKVFTGTEATAILLKARLEEIEVLSLIKNDTNSAFLGVIPYVVDLYIEESDLKKAEPVIADIINNLQE